MIFTYWPIGLPFVGTVQIFFCILVGNLAIYLASSFSQTNTTNQPGLKCGQRPWWYFDTSLNLRDDSEFSSPHCPPGYFIISGMDKCHRWLGCSDLNSIVLKQLIGYGAVKAVYRAKWNGFSIAYSTLNNVEYKDDFLHAISMLRVLQTSPVIVQLIGYCESEYVILTEYHQLGNAVSIISLLKTHDNILFRLKLCLNYARLLEYLHNSPAGIRVFCDSNDLVKLLSQLLITDKFTLLLGDVDALPEVSENNKFSITCGHQEIKSSFVAPEQLWPYEDSFDYHRMVGYDEKTDIWKAAAVCKYFVGNEKNSDVAHYHLFAVHKNCRNIDSTNRPSAKNLVSEYSKIISELGKNIWQNNET